MKKELIISSIIIQILLALNLSDVMAEEIQTDASNNYHIRKGYIIWDNGYIHEYKFNNTNGKIDYYYMFPIEKIKRGIPIEILENWDIDYKICTSIEAAELAMVEFNEMSNLGVYNIIDSLLPNGPIGDNCWYNLSSGVLRFLRNNLFVGISPKITDDKFPDIDLHSVELLARQLDSLIIESEKIKDFNQLFAPEIRSSDIISDLPKKWEDPVRFKINATDPNSQQLSYRRYSHGLSIISETGEISTKIYKSLDGTLDSTKAIVKVWIWNENHVFTLHFQEIPF